MSAGLRHYRTTAILLLSQGLVAGVALLVNVVSARTMGAAGRGTMALGLQLAYLATILVMMGVERPYASLSDRDWPGAVRELRALIARPLSAVLVASALAAGVAAATGSTVAALVAGTGVFVAGNAAARVARTAYVVSRNDLAFTSITVLTQALLGLGAVLSLVLELRSAAAWMALYAVAFAPVLLLLVVPRAAPSAQRDTQRAAVRRAGLAMLPASLGNTAMLRSDRLILPALGSMRELGLYVAVATVLELAAWPTQNLVDARLRHWTGLADDGRLTVLRPLAAASAATGIIAGVLGFGLSEYVVTWFGAEFAGARRFIPPLAVAAVLYAATRVLQGVLVARRLHRSVSVMEVSGMLASVAFYFLLIPALGGFGAAVGSALGYGVTLLIGLTMLARRTGTEVDTSTPVVSDHRG